MIVMMKTLASEIIVAVRLSVCVCQAQTPDAKFRLAQGYEQAGNFESAVKLYEELLLKDPSNYVYFDSVRRMYLQLKKYDDAVALIQRRLVGAPADLTLRAALASTYYKAGSEKDAYDEWERAISTDAKNPSVYRLVAQSLLENRLLDKAAELYRRARVACSDPKLFTMDLAQLLATSMDYAGASAEFLSWLSQNPTQLPFVQGRMASYTNKEEGRTAAIEAVKTELKRNEDAKLY